jgi:phosphoribosyl 1,2-cyclic phosphodiesterase
MTGEMRARIWGCRGSLAAPGPDTVRYGGNTSCVEVELGDDAVIVFDAGTGIRALGNKLRASGVKQVHLLLTHLHLDHLQGLGFFSPLFDPECEVHIWGPRSPIRVLSERIATYLSPPLFPVRLADIPASVTFHDVPDHEFEIGPARIAGAAVSHPDSTVGYRVEVGGRSLVYIPDHEPALGIDLRRLEASWISGYGLAQGADVLLHDAQYTDDEYEQRVGWGHSAMSHVLTFAEVARTRQLVLFHHDPAHDDVQLDELHRLACDRWFGEGAAPLMAYEGMELDISAPASTPDQPASTVTT